MKEGFQKTLDQIRDRARSEAEKGALFERLMQRYFLQDPLYADQFSDVWRWSEWAAQQPDFTGHDTGVDLVAEEREGGYCAIQCKFHAPGTRISKPALDSFIAASARDPFTRRMVVDTGAEWGPHAAKTIDGLKPPCQVLRFNDLAQRPIDWPDLQRQGPEALRWRVEPFTPRPHQQAAIDDVVSGFGEHDRGKLQPRHYRLGERAMRFADDETTVLIVNDFVRLAGIPPEAHQYVVNGRTPLGWFIDRYRVTQDKHSGIVNDPNGWFARPEDLVAAIRRIVHVSVETVRIVASLPQPFADPAGDRGGDVA